MCLRKEHINLIGWVGLFMLLVSLTFIFYLGTYAHVCQAELHPFVRKGEKIGTGRRTREKKAT